MCNEGRLKIDIERELFEVIERVEGYTYYQNGGSKTRAEYRCRQRKKGSHAGP